MTLHSPNLTARRRHRGVVLIITLLILLVLTLITTSAMQNAILERKIAGNHHHRQQSFEQAENMLQAGESWLQQDDTLSTPGDSYTDSGFRVTFLRSQRDHLETPLYGESNLAFSDYFLIENRQPPDSTGAQVLLQSVFIKRK